MLDLDNLDPDKVYTVYYVSEDYRKDLCFPINKEFNLVHDGTDLIPWAIRTKEYNAIVVRANRQDSEHAFSLYPVVPEDITTPFELSVLAEIDGKPEAELLSKDMYEVPTSLREGIC